ncbi:MAG: PfkB family carbohydrate kinase [Planctomycetota bacterium]|nr:PfkB family carbohydrate kinase [Planctomycetota bacterium]
MSLLVIGTLAYDTIETVHDKRDEALGGSAMYFAVAAAPFTSPNLVAVVGTDFQQAHLDDLAERGVGISGVEVAEGKTFRWGGRYEADWNTRHTTFTELNVFEHFDPKVPEEFQSAEFVFLANAHPAIQLKALQQVRGPHFSVADTMNLWIDVALDDLKALLRHVDGLILNDEEARMLTGESNLIQAAQQVMGMGPRYVILKKGEHGAFLLSEDVHFALPAYPVTVVVDPTGAGDSFAGGFMGSIARAGDTDPETMRKAMLYGTVTASFCVQGFSIEDLSRRTLSDIDERYNELLSIVTV